MDDDQIGELRQILAHWQLSANEFESIDSGHINLTYKVSCPEGKFALQRINPIFDPAIHYDIDLLTRKIAAAGLLSPRLVPPGKQLWVEDDRGAVWRLMTWVDGDMLLRADSPARCREAGRLLGRFHRILWDWEGEFRAPRLGVHDTLAHIRALGQAVATHRQHRVYAEIAPLAQTIADHAQALPIPISGPGRVVHGDPKISNVLFDGHGQALCLVDLDTLSRMPIALELGDAFRSWCHPGGEDQEGAFSLDYFAAGVSGWAESVATLPSVAEREAIVPATQIIAVELAARFCRDALEEHYFRWDTNRYLSASEHNLARARAQLSLARSIQSQRSQMKEAVVLAFSKFAD